MVVIPVLTAPIIAQAKMLAPISSFENKMKKLFLLKDRSVKGDITYCRYVLIGDPDRQKRSPGFGAGLTLTIKANKIQGESLLIKLGANRNVGRMFSVMLCSNVSYEALGKPAPKSSQSVNDEIRAYSSAIERALAGSPQSIRYQGYPVKITMSNTKDSDLLLAITPIAPANEPTAPSAGNKPPVKAPPK
jgi:hypothetical protein